MNILCQQRKEAWRAWTRDTWNLSGKKIYQLVKGKPVEPFTYLCHNGHHVTDRKQIDHILQESWHPIFTKYPTRETKAHEYRASFYPHSSSFLPIYSFSSTLQPSDLWTVTSGMLILVDGQSSVRFAPVDTVAIPRTTGGSFSCIAGFSPSTVQSVRTLPGWKTQSPP